MDGDQIWTEIQREIRYLLTATKGWADTKFYLVWNSDTQHLQILDMKNRPPGGFVHCRETNSLFSTRKANKITCNRITFLTILKKLVSGHYHKNQIKYRIYHYAIDSAHKQIASWTELEIIETRLEMDRSKRWRFRVEIEAAVNTPQFLETKKQLENLKRKHKELEKLIRFCKYKYNRLEKQQLARSIDSLPPLQMELPLISTWKNNNVEQLEYKADSSDWSSSSDEGNLEDVEKAVYTEDNKEESSDWTSSDEDDDKDD